jgi:hypothetical protein
MPSALNTTFARPETPPKIRAVFPALAILFFLILVCGMLTPLHATAKNREESIQRFDLQDGLSGLVDAAGRLTIIYEGSRSPLLETETDSMTDSRRRRGTDSFHATVVHGANSGHRGFSAQADDDQDGRIDEDPLDGIDNDRDGQVDEDFAAISDAMVAVRLGGPGTEGRGLQLEYYHWTTPRLSSAVFLNAGPSQGSAGSGSYRINSSGPAWQETRIHSLRHNVTGQPEQDGAVALVCRVGLDEAAFSRDPCAPGAGLWLGVAILDEGSSARFVLDRDQLALALGETPLPLVICAAESWMQLNRILGEARSVFEGMTDPVDNRRARWIVPPSCSACRAAAGPDFDLETGSGGELKLVAEISPGQCGLLDPDLFRVGDHRLGIPREIRWRPTEGPETTVPWNCWTADRSWGSSSPAVTSFPSFPTLQDHQAQGRLEFIFAPTPDVLLSISQDDPTATVDVVGRYLDGRTLEAALTPSVAQHSEKIETHRSFLEPEPETVEETTLRYAEDRARALNSSRNSPSLSADLLMGWPNPFNDAISIRFQVPRTMREAFVWKNEADKPTEIDLEGDVPWSGGQPGVSVKIYSISGQELVTLHSATQGVGEYTVQWNGTDAFGRKVASGTYFCKLQLDDWSVTRRLVFLR